MARMAVWRSTFEVAMVGALAGIAIPAFADEPLTHPVTLEIRGLRSDHGVVRAGLFDRRETFLAEGHEVARCVAEIHDGVARCALGEVADGAYALAFFHDEDDDGAIDRNFFGIPEEGFGFSNDAAPGLGPPSFESASFAVSARTIHRVHARYGL